MKRTLLLISVFILFFHTGCANKNTNKAISLLNQVITIKAGDYSYASGVIAKVNENFTPEENEVFILTSLHVVYKAAKENNPIIITFYKYDHHGQIVETIREKAIPLVGNSIIDLAILWLSVTKKFELHEANLLDYTYNRAGDELYICTRPGRYQPFLNEGILAGWYRKNIFFPLQGVFSGGVSKGSSGGGIFNKEGKCIGIINGILGYKSSKIDKDGKHIGVVITYIDYYGSFTIINKELINRMLGEKLFKCKEREQEYEIKSEKATPKRDNTKISDQRVCGF